MVPGCSWHQLQLPRPAIRPARQSHGRPVASAPRLFSWGPGSREGRVQRAPCEDPWDPLAGSRPRAAAGHSQAPAPPALAVTTGIRPPVPGWETWAPGHGTRSEAPTSRAAYSLGRRLSWQEVRQAPRRQPHLGPIERILAARAGPREARSGRGPTRAGRPRRKGVAGRRSSVRKRRQEGGIQEEGTGDKERALLNASRHGGEPVHYSSKGHRARLTSHTSQGQLRPCIGGRTQQPGRPHHGDLRPSHFVERPAYQTSGADRSGPRQCSDRAGKPSTARPGDRMLLWAWPRHRALGT